MATQSISNAKTGGLKLLLAMIIVPVFIYTGFRLKSSAEQFKTEARAIFAAYTKLSLNSLENMADEGDIDKISRFLSGINIPEKQMKLLKESFFWPFFINEALIDDDFPQTPMTNEATQRIWAEIPDNDSIPEKLLAHIDGPELKFDGNFPDPGKVVFSKTDTDFSRIYDEALLWYLTGRILINEGRTAEAFRVFTGIIDLAIAYENKRLSHPDKERRLQSCILREIAATGLIESAPLFFREKSDLISALSELKRRDASFAPIKQVLSFDKLIPVQFGAQLAREVKDNRAEAKYKTKLIKMPELFGDQTELNAILDPLYDPLIEALEHPYFHAQRAFNPWNKNFAKMFAEMSPESDFGTFKLIFNPDQFFRSATLEYFSENLPFNILTDVKTRQLSLGAQAAIVMFVYREENSAWPESLKDLQTWFGQPLPIDLIRETPLRFKAGDPPHLASIGRDGRAGTPDDMVFVPFGQKVAE